MTASGRLGGERSLRLQGACLDHFWADVDLLVAELMVDGFAPGKERPDSDYQKYQILLGQRGAGSYLFWGDTRAQAQLAKYEAQFAPAAAVSAPYAASGEAPLGGIQ